MAWPDIAQQLAQSEITPGSALERLVRDNQDFHMLRPEEADDTLRVPPWLRVYWRKQHPEANYDTGGYPRSLRNVYEWMVSHQNLEPEPQPEPSPPETSEEDTNRA